MAFLDFMDTYTKTYYKAASIQLASYLLVRGAIYVKTEQTFPNHFDFIFKNSKLCEELIQEFANGGQAPAQSLFEKRHFLVGEMKGWRKDE